MSRCLSAHISRSEMLTFCPSFLLLLLDQTLLNEHHFTFDGYWVDLCCHGLWRAFDFIALLLPHKLCVLFESTPVIFGAEVIGWEKKEEMLWGFRAGRTAQFEGHPSCSLSPYFLLGCFHMGPPEASVLAALSGGRTTHLWRGKSTVRVRSSSSAAVSQPWDLAPLQGQRGAWVLPSREMLLPKTRWQRKEDLAASW